MKTRIAVVMLSLLGCSVAAGVFASRLLRPRPDALLPDAAAGYLRPERVSWRGGRLRGEIFNRTPYRLSEIVFRFDVIRAGAVIASHKLVAPFTIDPGFSGSVNVPTYTDPEEPDTSWACAVIAARGTPYDGPSSDHHPSTVWGKRDGVGRSASDNSGAAVSALVDTTAEPSGRAAGSRHDPN